MWVSSPRWDLFFMFSALWLSALLFCSSALVPLAAITVYLFLANRLLGLAHSWSTTYMVLWSPLLREDRSRRRSRYLYVPLLLALLSLGLGLGVAYLPPTRDLGAGTWSAPIWAAFLGLFWVGHFWHFGNQDFGVLSIYRARARQSGVWDRRADRIGTGILMFVAHPILYLAVLVRSPLRQTVSAYLPWLATAAEDLALVALAVAAGVGLGLFNFELSKPNRSIPKLLYYTVITAHPLFLYFAPSGALPYYVVAYLWSHWLIAIGLVARINSNHQQRSRQRSPLEAWLRHALLLGAIAFAIGFLTYPHEAFNLFSREDFRATLSRIPADKRLFAGLLMGFFLAEQLVHYYCDRVLFRFRDEAIRKAVAPLL